MAENISEATLDEIRSLITEFLATGTQTPIFYAVTGSHLYGLAGQGSDIDVRGFHCVEDQEYVRLEQPPDQRATTRQLETTDAELDLTSYELREFGQQIATSDFTTIELLVSPTYIHNRAPKQLMSLLQLITERLPLDLPYRYRGLAETLFSERLNPTDSDQPTVKEYLYSLRGILAAEYVQEQQTIEPHLQTLVDARVPPPEQEPIDVLIERKQHPGDGNSPSDACQAVADLIESRLASFSSEMMDEAERRAYRETIDRWMLSFRDELQTDNGNDVTD